MARVSQTNLQDQGQCAAVKGERSCAEQELSGLEEGEDAMTDEEGEGVEGEGEARTADWRVRAGPRNKPPVREREEHEATHMPFRDWCAHCMMGRGRSHHHVSKTRSEGLSSRPFEAVDHCFLKPNSKVNSQTIPDESVTCIAVKEDRHQNIKSSVVLKKGIEEPLASEMVHRETTMKRDTEPESKT